MDQNPSRDTASRAATRVLPAQRDAAEAMPYLETAIPVGLMGAAAVAVFVFALDLAVGRPLATPNALGATIFRGMPFDLATPIAAIHIFSYTLLHSALFIVAATAAITAEFSLTREGVPLSTQFFMGAVSLFAALQASILTLLLLLNVPTVNSFGFSRLLAINAVAATVMATVTYLRANERIADERKS